MSARKGNRLNGSRQATAEAWQLVAGVWEHSQQGQGQYFDAGKTARVLRGLNSIPRASSLALDSMITLTLLDTPCTCETYDEEAFRNGTHRRGQHQRGDHRCAAGPPTLGLACGHRCLLVASVLVHVVACSDVRVSSGSRDPDSDVAAHPRLPRCTAPTANGSCTFFSPPSWASNAQAPLPVCIE